MTMIIEQPQKENFKIFLSLWNQLQNQKTPPIHFHMAHWLEKKWRAGDTRLLLQAFRSSGKSTIVGLFAAWLFYRRPNLRILVLAADLMLARKMVRNVKRILERHPLSAHLKPERADQWGAERFTIKRDKELRDPSMLAKGIGANITGSRADIIICDDVEVPNTCDTAEKREILRQRLTENDFILVPGGTMIYIGTPHSWYTIYADIARTEINETKPFLDGFTRLTLPVLNEKGLSAWPERFDLAAIERIRLGAGPNKFRSQMLLQPVNIAEGRLDPQAFQKYDAAVEYFKEIPLLQIGDTKMVSASAWWDPSFGKAGGDASVLAIVFTDEKGCYWLHHLAYIKSDISDTNSDEASDQCRQIARLLKAFYVPSVALEINGIGRFLPNILRRELAKAHVPCAVKEISQSRAKDVRIMEAFDTVLAARMLYVHRDIYQTPFIAEIQEWRPGLRGQKDDGLDAVAGALSQEPVRLKRFYHGGRTNWQKGRDGFAADTDFDI